MRISTRIWCSWLDFRMEYDSFEKFCTIPKILIFLNFLPSLCLFLFLLGVVNQFPETEARDFIRSTALIFAEGGKPEKPKKQQQHRVGSQPTYEPSRRDGRRGLVTTHALSDSQPPPPSPADAKNNKSTTALLWFGFFVRIL